MILFKLLPYKKWYILLCLVFSILIYHQVISHMIFFDDIAFDLVQIQGESVKLKLIYGLLSLNNSLFEYNFFQAFLLPLLILFIGKIYDYLKNRYCRYFLGRSQKYFLSVKKLKLILSTIGIFSFSLIFALIVTISLLVDRFELSGIEFYFQSKSILTFFGNSTSHYLIYYFLVKSCALLTEILLFFSLIDYFNHFTKATLLYLTFLWGTAPILYCFSPFYLVPMSHIMITSYGNLNLWNIFATYLPACILYIYLNCKNAYDII
ncbi:hypothetical protein DIX90_06185 [Streptococcus iniae]|uniref:hypothetical protein n=1 Tax=Streptococcus iniae TaxID=1346 RepID=UPI000EF6D2F6|nr:hypothetical protein [Streptococcus iniae]RLU59909.1 hypothetical protein DIY02_06390 [Streptococcus iniae]RLU61767.1 hypothetical protein DIY01_06205 [Streptococcus iniae]RLU70292.1 hypothetical protein DIX97_06395 [Streptococcus iniae]RLU84244.1 hypothetical protein DIX91_06190 [Streptococcus iniae]RLU84437.1 hypothetical protein DIX90_06185 [Streptococcus iniae]